MVFIPSRTVLADQPPMETKKMELLRRIPLFGKKKALTPILRTFGTQEQSLTWLKTDHQHSIVNGCQVPREAVFQTVNFVSLFFVSDIGEQALCFISYRPTIFD